MRRGAPIDAVTGPDAVQRGIAMWRVKTTDPAVAVAAPHAWAPGDREQVAVVSFSHMIQHSYAASLGVVYPFALLTFHTSYAVLGVILGAVGVLGGMLQGLAAFLKRRYSARVMLGSQNLGMALASVFASVSPGIGLFAAARVFGTLTSWPQHPVGSAHLTERVPHRRGFVLAAHTTGGNLGTLVAPLLCAAFIAAFDWRWALVAMGAMMALASIVTWTRVRANPDEQAPDHERAPHDHAPGGAERATATPSGLGSALRRREAVAVLVAGTISGAGRGLGVLMTYIPAYLRDGLHKPALVLGALVTVMSCGAVLGPMLAGHLSDKEGRRRTVLYTLYGFGAAALCAYVLVGSSVILLALVGVMVGAFSYSEQPIRQALFSDAMRGVDARRAFGAYFGISQTVGALWLTIIGFLMTDVGYRAAFFVMAGSFVAAASVIAIFGRPQPSSEVAERAIG